MKMVEKYIKVHTVKAQVYKTVYDCLNWKQGKRKLRKTESIWQCVYTLDMTNIFSPLNKYSC